MRGAFIKRLAGTDVKARAIIAKSHIWLDWITITHSAVLQNVIKEQVLVFKFTKLS
jgi:hypothetical protein